jgi:hypothetical protein
MRKSQIFITPYPLFMKIKVQISVGELFDKISILEIKKNMITDPTKISNILKELITLEKVCKKKDLLYKKDPNYNKLFKVNSLLWDIEEGKRRHEKIKLFNKEFIELARQVYIQNDKRAKIKKAINKKYNSEIIEEKSY